MKGRVVIVAAVAVYLAVVGCVIWPGGGSGSKSTDAVNAAPARNVKLEGLPLRGITLQIQDVSRIFDYKVAVDQIAATGADTIQFVVSARQEHGGSGRIFLDLRQTPTGDQLGELIRHAKKHGLRVQVMPIVLLQAARGNEWRGTIKPELWSEWFDSYREMLGYYADVAEANKVDILVVGSELVSTEGGDKAGEWAKTIRMVRGKFHGLLTYSANWDHYQNIPFWDQLDLIGMNSYWKLGEDRKVSVEEIVQRWQDIQKDLVAFSNKKRKPIVLIEVGWCSLGNAANEPWDYTKYEEGLDLELQRRLYQGFFQAWQGNPNLGGFYFWEWSVNGAGPQDRGYSPQGKPAEKVLKEWLAKPAWEVK